jgi:hypothetical protein
MPNKKPTLDDYLSKKKKVPSKNKRGSVPPDYDVILPGMGYTKPTAKKQPKKRKVNQGQYHCQLNQSLLLVLCQKSQQVL